MEQFKKWGGLGLALLVFFLMDILDLQGAARIIGWITFAVIGGVIAWMWDKSNNRKKKEPVSNRLFA